nr:hypothetical protein [Tanacetum cinerariifolium]
TAGTHDHEADSSSRAKRHRKTKIVEDAMLGRVYHQNLLWTGCNKDVKNRYNTVLTHLISKQAYSSCIVDWTILNTLGCAETIKEMLEIKVVEFFYMFEFDKEVTDDELISKKLIKFRLGGRRHSLSFLEFARRLGTHDHEAGSSSRLKRHRETKTVKEAMLRHVYHPNLLWTRCNRNTKSRSDTQTIRSPILRVLQKMITYGLCQRITGGKGIDTQEGRMIVYGQFVTKLAKKMQLLTYDVLDGLNASIQCRFVDATTLRELIGPDGRLIAENPAPGVSRFAIPRPLRSTLQDLSDKIGHMKIQ